MHDPLDLKTTIIHQGDDSLGPTMSFGTATMAAKSPPKLNLPRLRLSFSNDPTDSDFVVLEELGTGGVGIVELAQQTMLSREVAVKRVRDPSKTDHVQSLLREANVTGQLEHPNVIPVHTIGEDENVGVFVAMKHVQGRSWGDLLREKEEADHLEILSNVCQAVGFAHAQGIVHRDLKPDNVMIGEFGEVYVVDWGLAVRDSEPKKDGSIVGTPAYMAPEMAYGHVTEIDSRSDVYLLGAILYEILEGEPPHLKSTSMESLIHGCQNEPFKFTSDQQPLIRIVQKACRTDRDQRHQNAAEFRDALSEYLDHRIAFDVVQRSVETFDRAMSRPTDERFELLGEARFGFEQALEIWSEVRGAKDGLRASNLELARLELDAGNLERVERILKRVTSPPSEILSKLEEGRERKLELEQADAKLKEIEKRTNIMSGGNPRMVLGIVTLTFAAASGFILNFIFPNQPTNLHLFLVMVAFFVSFSTTHLLLYKRIPQTQPNRSVIGAIYMAVACSAINRLSTWYFDIMTAHAGIADLMIFSMTIYSIRKLLKHPRIMISILNFGGVITILFPEYNRLIYNVVLIGILAWVVVDWNSFRD